MQRWLSDLQQQLAGLETHANRRHLRSVECDGPRVRVDGRWLLNLASNDYLGLHQHPRLIEAACEATRQFGVGATASRLVSGSSPLHAEVEEAFAQFKHAPAALLCPTGYMANLAAITALAGPGDLICLDKLNHASLIDASHASGATVRVYPHQQLSKLERLLQRHAQRSAAERSRAFIVTDSVFSMDGDVADLPAICDLAERYDAIVIVDEAHGTGILGETGAGLAELQGVTHRVGVTISTASKAMGGLGGIITAARPVIETLINRARSFIYTTAVPPAQAAVIAAALQVIRDEPQRRQRVLTHVHRLHEMLGMAPSSPVATPIVPLIAGSSESALDLASALADAGFFAPAIRPPTVAPDTARVRLALRADLEADDIDRLAVVINRLQCSGGLREA